RRIPLGVPQHPLPLLVESLFLSHATPGTSNLTRVAFTASLSHLAMPLGQSEVLMSRMLLGASAAALIFGYAHVAFADEAGAVPGGVAGAIGGGRWGESTGVRS